ncbi:hypothetical protein [Hymenobacter sp.]|uniref:hypothetical protein n=1 Tax=Hymenobacter sp. TaxID=1898978 RepID=UPI002EDA6628
MKPVLKQPTWLVLLLVAALAACNRTPKALDPASATAAKQQLEVLRDSVDARWTEMTASDDAKITATNQMLNELERWPAADKAQLKQLTQANNRLKGLRYQQLSMQSTQIDRYDTAQDSLLSVLRAMTSRPDGPAPSTTVLNTLDTIGQYDGEVVGYRVKYDQAAKRFNNYIQLHQAELQSLGGKYKQLTPLPLFELPE